VAEPLSKEHAALGEAIRDRRAQLSKPSEASKKKQHLSQEDLASRANVHRTYASAVERGERNLSYANLLKIAGALDLSASELLRRAERKLQG
jgi:predicted transcriptional regulator